MYATILVPLEISPTDQAIIQHIKKLAKWMNSRVVLFHVATDVQAQYHGENANGERIHKERDYLAKVQQEFESMGISTTVEFGFGDPPREIVKWVQEHDCDLVAMSTHGHRFFLDLLFGVTASRVQHSITVPVLLIKAQ